MSKLRQAAMNVRLSARLWVLLLVALDAAVVALAAIVAYYARFEGMVPAPFDANVPRAVGLSIAVYLGLFAAFGLYRLVLRYVGVDTLLRVAGAALLGFAALVTLDLIAPLNGDMRPVPFGVLFIQALLVMLAVSGIRLAVRVALFLRARQTAAGRRVLVVGAGSAGSLLLREIQGRPDLGLAPVGVLDDNPNLQGRTLMGVPVVGTTAQLAQAAERRGAQEIIVALPSAPQETIRRILNEAADAGLTTRITPAIVMAKGAVSVTDLRRVEVEDLLGREPTPIDVHRIAETIEGKVVAVTGAAGSIGSELCRQVMSLHPKRLLLLEIDETRLYELWLELTRIDADVPVMRICDVRDARKLDEVFSAEKPQVVLHAAAYKHVPLMELSPAEAVKTNVLGTRQVVEACERHGAERFVLISTDKAVAPANVMGLTKSLAERVTLSAARRGRVLACAVRFGNVLGSRGSVVPIFEEQLRRGGPVTVTDPEVTRYFMTIPEAARLVLQAQAIGTSGDVFVLEMGEPVKIVDLARKMIALSGVPADIEFTGLRPGEKLHEVLIEDHERLEPTSAAKVQRVSGELFADEGFDEEVQRLIDAALTGDEAAISASVARLEPGFAARQGS